MTIARIKEWVYLEMMGFSPKLPVEFCRWILVPKYKIATQNGPFGKPVRDNGQDISEKLHLVGYVNQFIVWC